SPPYMYFYPNEKKIYPLYKRAEELQIPVVFHTGSSIFKGSRLKYANPIYLDDVAVDFPELVIIQAHGGRGIWYDTAYFLAKLHPNIYLDITGLPPQNLLKYYPELEKIQDKVIYGSDYPAIGDLKKNIERIKSLPISKKAIEKILGKNARKILKI
ncbi:MAG: amidohydrolase family protein, partial [Methanocellales archaeon]